MKIYSYLGFLFALAALATGIAGIELLSNKPTLPFAYEEINNSIVVTEDFLGFVSKGSFIKEFNGDALNDANQVEFRSDVLNVGDEVTLKIQNGKTEYPIKVKLVKAYKDSSFLYVSSTIGITFWFLGFFVFMRKPKETTAKVLFAMLIIFSVAIMTSPGKYYDSLLSYSTLVRVLHMFAYTGGISLLIHFSLIFPKRIYGSRFAVRTVYVLITILGLAINFVQLKIAAENELFYVDLYHTLWKVLLFVLLSGAVWAIINFAISFFSNKEDSDRRRVQWALWGLLTGLMPYILFWVIPNLLNSGLIIDEEYSMAFLILIPLSFVIGVLKYKLFDIEFIFSKSIVYGTITIVLTGLFFFTIYALSTVFSNAIGEMQPVYSLISAVFIAIIFNPLRVKVQGLVDKYFYRVRYDFRKAIKKVNQNLADCNTSKELGEKLLREINEIIPTRKSSILLKGEEEQFRLLAGINESTENTDITDAIINNHEYIIMIPLTAQLGKEIGAIMLGEKLSGIKYLDSDLEILKTFADNAASLLQRIELREKIIINETEKKRLEELNSMKSDFVSSVSHELKTPLTSIQLFAETLMSDREIPKEKQKEYAEIIYGESGRLTRIINTILDFSKIERGIKKYYFETICVNSILEYILNTMEYQFKKNNAELIKDVCSEKLFINADSDAISEVLINLLSNALKYSGENPKIEISLKRESDYALISVKDNGKGIEEKELENIFENFYRIQKENEKHTGGAGIGLAIVKNIMNAHEGEIKVESEVGKGSTFLLRFKISET
jgi:signal transduction histidine kinase